MESISSLEQTISKDMKSLERKLESVFSSHLKSAEAEGSAFEARILALVKELVMTTATDLQGKINTLSSKFSQVEADVGALVSKEGSATSNAGSAGLATQDQLDSMGTAVDGLSTRADALVQLVVNGASNPPATQGGTPSASPPSTPAPPSTTPVTNTPPVSPTSPATPPASPTPSAPGAPSTPAS